MSAGRLCIMLKDVALRHCCGDEQVPDYYAVLGVDENASGEDIRGAYKRLVLELHPDRTE